MGCDSRSQSSATNQFTVEAGNLLQEERNTEFTNQECLGSIRRPFPIGDIVLLVHIEAKLLCALCSSVCTWSLCDVHSLC